MFFKGCYMLLILLLRWVSVCKSQTFVECDVGYQCVYVSSCSALEVFLEEKDYTSVQSIREKVCAREGGKEKVCCPGFPEHRLPSKCGTSNVDYISPDGSPTTPRAYPWIVALGYAKKHNESLSLNCLGSVISSKYVLTAAHCLFPQNQILSVVLFDLESLNKETNVGVTFPDVRVSPSQIIAGIEETVVHPQYERNKHSHDIGLIRLNVSLNFEDDSVPIKPVCLPPHDFDFKSFVGDRKLVVSGWGWSYMKSRNSTFRSGHVSVGDDALCRKIYNETFDNQLCIGGNKEDFATCSGDAGGPLVIPHKYGPPFIQVGIVSYGIGCGLYPDVYTNVAFYRNWIGRSMKE